MNLKPFSISSDVLVPAAMGVVAAVAYAPFSVLALLVWLLAAIVKARARWRTGETRGMATGVVTSALIFCGIVSAAAWYRPAKVVQQQLEREVTLPSTRMTLAELSYVATYDRPSLPMRTHFDFAAADQDVVVEWPRERLTFGEFLDAIEAQTALRRRFAHCGNGYTVLGGGDCSFGLEIRDPQLLQNSASRPYFDLEEYAAARHAKLRADAMNHVKTLLAKVIDEAAAGNDAFCILLESKKSSDKWVQLTSWDEVNAAYPLADDPAEKLAALVPAGFKLSAWEPRLYVTWEHGGDRLDDLAAFIVVYFEQVLGASSAKNDLRVEEQQL
jgi:hypothetical protein